MKKNTLMPYAGPRLYVYKRHLLAENKIMLCDRVERALTESPIGSDIIAAYDIKYGMPSPEAKRNIFMMANTPGFDVFLLDLSVSAYPVDFSIESQSMREACYELSTIIRQEKLMRAEFFAGKLQIGSSCRDVYEPPNNRWHRLPLDFVDIRYRQEQQIIFYSASGSIDFVVTLIVYGDNIIALPVAFFGTDVAPGRRQQMAEMPYFGRAPLYNAEKIAQNKSVVVMLTDELAIAVGNRSDDKQIFSSWYGGMEVADWIPFAELTGHRVEWLCFQNAAGTDEHYRKAAQMIKLFHEHSIDLKIRMFDFVRWNVCAPHACGIQTAEYEEARVLSKREFAEEAAQFGIRIDSVTETLTVRTADELRDLKPEPYLIEPVLKRGFYCVVYGGTGVAKTWFVLGLTLAASNGRSCFDRWRFIGNPVKVLYVAGEMSESVFGGRIDKLLHNNGGANFMLLRENLNLVNETDQKRLEVTIQEHHPEMVVLDNLSTLTVNGTGEAGFMKIRTFFASLQRQGIAVILIHHENKAGTFKGTGMITDVADMAIHLYKTGDSSDIEVLVEANKVRENARTNAATFRAAFNPEHPECKWHTFDLTPEERRKLGEDDPLDTVSLNLGKKRRDTLAWKFMDDQIRGIEILTDLLGGSSDDVIAANFAIPELAIRNFRVQYRISEERIDELLPGIRKDISCKTGNNSLKPKDLAAPLWEKIRSKNVSGQSAPSCE